MLRELRGALTALALIAVLVLAAASFDIGIPGQSLLQTLRFHLAAVLVVLVVLLLASGAWWRAVLLLLPLLASLGQGASIILRQQDARPALADADAPPLLRLMSFNMLTSNVGGARQVADYIAASGVDVVMLMEAVPLDPFLEELAANYPYRAGCNGYRPCDVVLLSRLPLRDIVVGELSRIWSNRVLAARVDVGGTEVNLVLAHMVKPYFDRFAEDEAWRLNTAMEALPGPLVLAGDFNAAAWSVNIDRLMGWQDLAPGPSYPATWPVALGALGVPIDGIFARRPLVVRSVDSIDDPMGSNHRGLIAEIALAGG